MKVCSLFILLCFVPLLWASSNESDDSLFHYGVVALSDHDYEVAIGLLEQDVAINQPSFEALYNLSQAYAAVENWNNAYYFAERALKFSPNNSIAKENVRYTLSNLNTEVEFQHPYTWLQRFVMSISSIIWYTIGILASIGSAILIFLLLSKHSRSSNKMLALLFGLLLLTFSSYFAGTFRSHEVTSSTFALAMEQNTPTFASKDGIELNQVLLLGQRYTILEDKESWIKLAYPDGQPVWVPTSMLLLY